MQPFTYGPRGLQAEEVPLSKIADEFGTPCYVYSRAALTHAYQALDGALARALKGLPHLICYAIKANSNLAVLDLFAKLGSGFDIVSGGEMERVLAAGGDPAKIVFSGVGKTVAEMQQALQAGIACFNAESESELRRLNNVAGEMGRRAPVSLRVNPDVDPKTHHYISTGLKDSKFGVAFKEAPRLYRLAASLPHLRVVGIDCHIGSQITEIGPFRDAFAKVLGLVDELRREGSVLEHLDLGGGLGIRYRDETPLSLAEYANAIAEAVGNRSLKIILEPGRSLVGNAGILLARVEYLKPGETRNFAVVDAAMNDLLRPALYEAWHDVLPVQRREGATQPWEIVGPVCESADFLAQDRDLCLMEGDLLAIMSAGAYGMSMSSNYNSRPRAAEVMVDGTGARLIRAREPVADLYAHEHIR
ncbi:MAG: diaminopimelate decarboxylase [Betaproteobacteria bacterium]|nr:diaminopimelate decarboxylase [Betaproteobacteria bacterium]